MIAEVNAPARPEAPCLRVAFCVDNLQVGGTELNAVRLAERLDRRRFSLRLVSLQPDGPLAARYRAAGVPIDVFSPRSLAGASAIREGLRLMSYVRRHGVEVFHAHDLYSNLFACHWARLAGAKVIASRRWQGVPVASRGRVWRAACRVPYHVAHASMANSPRVAEMLERIDRVPRRRISVVPNFVDEGAFASLSAPAREAFVRDLGLSGAGPVIGMIANLRPVKDHATLLRAVGPLRARWPEIRVVLVGEGAERPSLERLAETLGIGRNVVFTGYRPNHPNLNQLFDAAVLCSLREGLPNSVLEAMAAATPVVATDVGAIGDAVADGETGLLVPPANPERLSAALAQLLDDPARARRMGAAGRQRALASYSPEAALGALETLYIRLARREGALLPAPVPEPPFTRT